MSNPKDLHIKAFHLKCYSCGEEFNVHFVNMKDKKEINCPNCGNKVPDKALTHFRNCVNELEKGLKKIHETNTNETGWGISFKWSKVNITPQNKNDITYTNGDYRPFRC